MMSGGAERRLPRGCRTGRAITRGDRQGGRFSQRAREPPPCSPGRRRSARAASARPPQLRARSQAPRSSRASPQCPIGQPAENGEAVGCLSGLRTNRVGLGGWRRLGAQNRDTAWAAHLAGHVQRLRVARCGIARGAYQRSASGRSARPQTAQSWRGSLLPHRIAIRSNANKMQMGPGRKTSEWACDVKTHRGGQSRLEGGAVQ